MNMTKRRIAITVGAVVLVAGVVAGRERPSLELIQENAAARSAPRGAAKDDGIDLARLDRGAGALPQVDPFSQKNFTAQGTPAAQVAEKPAAPPLPFQYFGRITENGKTDVFVMRGDELLAVAPGQKLGEYRVDKIGASSIAFTYLPLKARQTLEIQ
jgi:hypothetical protein